MEPANLQAFVTRASDSELYVHRSCICICIIDEHVAKLYVTATRVRIVKKKGCLRRLPDFSLFLSFFLKIFSICFKVKDFDYDNSYADAWLKNEFYCFPDFCTVLYLPTVF